MNQVDLSRLYSEMRTHREAVVEVEEVDQAMIDHLHRYLTIDGNAGEVRVVDLDSTTAIALPQCKRTSDRDLANETLCHLRPFEAFRVGRRPIDGLQPDRRLLLREEELERVRMPHQSYHGNEEGDTDVVMRTIMGLLHLHIDLDQVLCRLVLRLRMERIMLQQRVVDFRKTKSRLIHHSSSRPLKQRFTHLAPKMSHRPHLAHYVKLKQATRLRRQNSRPVPKRNCRLLSSQRPCSTTSLELVRVE